MLESKTLGVSCRLADDLLNRGFYLTPESGSLLETLVDSSAPQLGLDVYYVPQTDGNGVMTAKNVSDILDFTSKEVDPTGNARHNRVMEDTLQLVANSIRADHQFARNGVNPVIRQIVEAVEAAEAGRSGEGDLRPNVMPYFYADLWDNSSWMAIVDRYADIPVTKALVPTPVVLSAETSLTELLLTGVGGLDEDIKVLLENRGEAFVAMVFKAVFENDGAMTHRLELRGNSFEDGWFFSNSRLATDAVVITHLLARAMSKLPAADGYSADSWQAMLATVIGSSGHRLHRAATQRVSDRKAKLLVLAYGYSLGGDAVITSGGKYVNPLGGNIVVNGDLYTEYLEKGGSPEALMGSSYSSQLTGLEDLLAQQDALASAYRRRETTLNEQQQAKRHSRIVELLRTEIFRYLNSCSEDQLVRSREQYVEAIRAELSLFRDNDLNALWFFVRRLVCKVFFPHTNALRCLTKLDEVALRMPDADVQVASFHATIEILIDWLMESVTIKKS